MKFESPIKYLLVSENEHCDDFKLFHNQLFLKPFLKKKQLSCNKNDFGIVACGSTCVLSIYCRVSSTSFIIIFKTHNCVDIISKRLPNKDSTSLTDQKEVHINKRDSTYLEIPNIHTYYF